MLSTAEPGRGEMSGGKAGRPSSYSDEITDHILSRLMDGESLRRICRDDGMPDRVTVLRWLEAKPDFAAKYARAREMQGDVYAAETIEIADEEEDPQRARVRVQARQWYAAKLAPKKYGDKVQTEISGPDGGPVEVAAVTDEQRAKAMALLLAKRSLPPAE